jgi:hypothetical protein
MSLFVKLRQKCRSPGVYLGSRLEVRRSPRQSFVQSGAIYRRIWLWGVPMAGGALKPPAFSLGCLRTETKGPPRGPGYVLRLEDPLVPARNTNQD